jgi:TP901 family phage tail tape measure protein
MAEIFRLEASVAVLINQAIKALQVLETRAQASVQVLQNVSRTAAALANSLNQNLSAASNAFQQFSAVVGTSTGTAANQLDLLARNLRTSLWSTTQAMAGINQEARQLLSTIGQLNQRIGRLATASQQAGAGAGVAIKQAGTEFADLVSLLGSGALFTGAATAATEFDQAMRNVNAVLQESEPSFARLYQEILNLSQDPNLAAGPIDIAKALFTVTQAGYDAEDALKIVQAAAKAASAGMTDTETAINGLIAVMKTYNITTAEVQRASDFLFQTYLDGAISFEELSRQIGIVLGIAKQAGVRLEEVGAAISVATIRGFQSGRAFTALRQAITHLTARTAENIRVQKQYGIHVDQSTIQLEGLARTFDRIYQAVGQSQEALEDLLGDVDAAALVATLAADNFEEFNQRVAAQRENIGATSRAWSQVAQGSQTHIKKMQASLEKLAITMSQTLVPALKHLTTMVGGMAEALAAMPQKGQNLIFWASSALLGFLALGNGIRLFTMALASARAGMAALIATPFAASLTGIGVAAGAAAAAIEMYRQRIEELDKSVKAEADNTVALAKLMRELPTPPKLNMWEVIDDFSLSYSKFVQIKQAFPANEEALQKFRQEQASPMNERFQQWVEKNKSAIIDYARAVGSTANGVQRLTEEIRRQETQLKTWVENYDTMKDIFFDIDTKIAKLTATLAMNKKALEWLTAPAQSPLLEEVRRAQAQYVVEMNRKTEEAMGLLEKFKKFQEFDVFRSDREELAGLKEVIQAATDLALRGDMADIFQKFQADFAKFNTLFSTADARQQVELLIETMNRLREEALKLPDQQRKTTLAFLDVLEEALGKQITLQRKAQEELLENEKKYHSERIKNRLQEIEVAQSGVENRLRLAQEEVRVVVNGETLLQGTIEKTAAVRKITSQQALEQLRAVYAEAQRLQAKGLVTGDQVRSIEDQILKLLKQQVKERQDMLKLEARYASSRAEAVNLELQQMKQRNASESELIAKIQQRLQLELEALEKEMKAALESAETAKEKAAIKQEYQNKRKKAELEAQNDIQSAQQESLRKQEELTSLRNELRQSEISQIDRMLEKLSEQSEQEGVNTTSILQQQESLLKKRLDLQIQSIQAETEAAAASAEAAGEAEKALLIRQKGEMKITEARQETQDAMEKLRKESQSQSQTKFTGGRIMTLEEFLKEQSEQFGPQALGKSPFADTSSQSTLSAPTSFGMLNQQITQTSQEAIQKASVLGWTACGTWALNKGLSTSSAPSTGAISPQATPKVGPAVQTTKMEVEFKASGEIKVTNPGPFSSKTAQLAAEELARKFYTAGDRSSGLGRNV